MEALAVQRRVRKAMPRGHECPCPLCGKILLRERSVFQVPCRECWVKKRTIHGMKNTPIYIVWKNIHARCRNPNHIGYRSYGGRGISVCADWTRAAPFIAWAMANGWQYGLQIDRIDNDGNY